MLLPRLLNGVSIKASQQSLTEDTHAKDMAAMKAEVRYRITFTHGATLKISSALTARIDILVATLQRNGAEERSIIAPKLHRQIGSLTKQVDELSTRTNCRAEEDLTKQLQLDHRKLKKVQPRAALPRARQQTLKSHTSRCGGDP